jgi:hypothetical protein
MVHKFSAHAPIVLVFLVSILMMSCRKENFIPISGLITDPNQAIPVENAKIEIWTQHIEGGIFEANYTLISTVTTGLDGTFLFNLENKNFTGIRLIFSKQGYFGWQADLNIEKVKSSQSYYAEYLLLPRARLHIRVVNSFPVNSNDYFEFRILNGYSDCEECCKAEKYQFTGLNIDQTIDCQTVGHQFTLIQWSKNKNGEQTSKTESYFINAFETSEIELKY